MAPNPTGTLQGGLEHADCTAAAQHPAPTLHHSALVDGARGLAVASGAPCTPC